MGGGGGQRVDEGCGRVDDGLAPQNGSHLQSWLPRWRRGWERLSMLGWRHCTNSMTLTSRPTRLELITSN